MFVICDIDNCISDDSWRMGFISWHDPFPFTRYHAYHLLSPWDEARNRDMFSSEDDFIFSTARPNHYRASTEHWLNKFCGKQFHLMMRGDTDHRCATLVKQQQLSLLRITHGLRPGNTRCCFDDRQDIVDMYRAAGYNAERVWIHNISGHVKEGA